MIRILLDSNVILDVLLDRQPHAKESGAVWRAVERRFAQGYVAAHSITTIYYLARKKHGSPQARRTVGELLTLFSVAPVDEFVLREAAHSSLPDFEDAVTVAAARISGCTLVVTRDPRGFRGDPMRCLSPAEALPMFTP